MRYFFSQLFQEECPQNELNNLENLKSIFIVFENLNFLNFMLKVLSCDLQNK